MKLNKCPFCGGEVYVKCATDFWEPIPKEIYRIEHKDADSNCYLNGIEIFYKDEAALVNSWNVRVVD